MFFILYLIIINYNILKWHPILHLIEQNFLFMQENDVKWVTVWKFVKVIYLQKIVQIIIAKKFVEDIRLHKFFYLNSMNPKFGMNKVENLEKFSKNLILSSGIIRIVYDK